MKRTLRRNEEQAMVLRKSAILGLTVVGGLPHAVWGEARGLQGELALHGNISGVHGIADRTLTGDASSITGLITNITGRISRRMHGDVSGLSGDVTGIEGNATGIEGDITQCGLTAAQRKKGVPLSALVRKD